MRRASILALLPIALASELGAQPDPSHHWRTLDTPHFHVHAPAGLEREGRVAAAAAERAYGLLARELVAPRGPIDLVVSDDADYSNGYATPFPSNRIVVFATPPVEAEGLRLNEDWLQLVVTHELTHIFHLDRARGIWAVGQQLFGRAPVLFPNGYLPSWLVEGLAVYYESRLTTGGRLADAQFRDYARAAAREDRLPELNSLSLSTPRFPGGDAAYGYGALLMEHLGRVHGDSAIPRFVERQSGALIPLLSNRAASAVFGETFTAAFDSLRDSVRRSLRVAAPSSRALTTHPYFADAARWVNDTTLVYTGGDGRESNAAWLVTTSGTRTRLGRRNGFGANVPIGDRAFLFAQPDYVAREEVRSDLYVQRDDEVTRLTYGARLIQPDARADGTIVAVQLDAARARLVILDHTGHQLRVLREVGPDETWSEPRWSPDGSRIAAIRRPHAAPFELVLLDAATGATTTLATSASVLASPAWRGDGRVLSFTREDDGTPTTHVLSLDGGAVGALPGFDPTLAVATPEWSRDGTRLAASVLVADGWRLALATGTLAQVDSASSASSTLVAGSDRQPLAAGDYHDYRAARSLVPRYWLPVLESGPFGATRLGALTSGSDVVGRQLYAAHLAIETSGRFATGSLSYRYAGWHRPYLDVALSQDWTEFGYILDAYSFPTGALLKRTQDASIAATWVRPRYRTYAALTAGLGLERRTFAADPASTLALADPSFGGDYRYPRAFVGASWSNAQRPRLAISHEDGLSLAVTARERFRLGAATDSRSTSLVGTANGYRALTSSRGFAHHVAALRLSGGWSDARTPSAFEVGGTSGSALEVAPGVTVGEGRRTFGVRGFPTATIYGTQALAASLEYRAPLALGGVGLRGVPIFFDRSSVALFGDAGSAWCAANVTYAGLCSPAPAIGSTLASVGAELGISLAVLAIDVPQLVRLGVAVPVAGRGVANRAVDRVAPASVYVAFGYSF
jgi:hypothetical protein